jgi:hypothetical protein
MSDFLRRSAFQYTPFIVICGVLILIGALEFSSRSFRISSLLEGAICILLWWLVRMNKVKIASIIQIGWGVLGFGAMILVWFQFLQSLSTDPVVDTIVVDRDGKLETIELHAMPLDPGIPVFKWISLVLWTMLYFTYAWSGIWMWRDRVRC